MKAEVFRILRENIKKDKADAVAKGRIGYGARINFLRVFKGDVVELEGGHYDQFEGWTKRKGVVLSAGQDNDDITSWVRLTGPDGIPVKVTTAVSMGGARILKAGRRARQEFYRQVKVQADRRCITVQEFLTRFPAMAKAISNDLRRGI